MLHLIIHTFEHSIIDTVKLIPFLLVVFVILEYIEHSMNNKTSAIIEKSGKVGPLIGGALGAFPQCGFSAMATNLFGSKIITMGTLVAVYLSTSDEMLPIMISQQSSISKVLTIVLLKAAFGIIVGFIVDLIFKPSPVNISNIESMCHDEHCDCKHRSPFVSALHHTIHIIVIIMLVTFALNFAIELIGEDTFASMVQSAGIFAPIVAGIIGLIPNCAASVIITQLYISGTITLGTTMAGLLASSGIGWVILFRVNKNLKENFKVMSIVYISAILCGILIDMLKITL